VFVGVERCIPPVVVLPNLLPDFLR